MKSILSAIFLLIVQLYSSQISDTLKISKTEAENIFLVKNFDLIIQKLQISQAEAQLVQSKYWPNPNFSISEVNLWKNGSSEIMPPLINNWGKTSQVSMEIEQVIQTAGKRRKNIELHKIELDGKKYEFQEVLRELKRDLRNSINNVLYFQEQQKLYHNLLGSIQRLTKAYKNQFSEGNISKSEYIRLKSQEVELNRKLIEINQDLLDEQDNLKAYLAISPTTHIMITDELTSPNNKLLGQNYTEYFKIAQENRPDLLISKNEEIYAKKNYELQNAMKVPDLAFSVNYDRGGNIMRDFVGVGVSFDLPIFDRNKGNISAAKLEIEKKELDTQKNTLKSQNEIVNAYRNYQNSYMLIDKMEEDFDGSLDKLFESHEKNFRLRNINMLEFLDFFNAYIDNKNIFLETKKELNQYYENLQYAVGQDL